MFLTKKETYTLKDLLEQGRLEESVSKQIRQMSESLTVTATESKRTVDIDSNINEVRSTHKRTKFQNERQDYERKPQRAAAVNVTTAAVNIRTPLSASAQPKALDANIASGVVTSLGTVENTHQPTLRVVSTKSIRGTATTTMTRATNIAQTYGEFVSRIQSTR